jgi:signal transduction histidine kinase
MNLFAFSTLVTSLLSFALAVFVVRMKNDSKLNWAWFLVGFSVGVWSLGLWGVISAENESVAMIFQYLLDFGAILSPIAYFRFLIVLLGLDKKKKKEVFLITLVGVVLIFLSFSSFFKEGVEKIEGGSFNYWISTGPVYVIFPILFLCLNCYSMFLGVRYYKISKGLLRSQIKYVILAGLVGFMGGSTNFFPQITGDYPIGNYFVFLYVIAMSYAIIKHRLMGIRLIVSKIYIYLIIALLVYLYFQYMLYVHILVFSGEATLIQLTLFDLSSTLIFAIALLPFLVYIQKSSDILFFRGQNPRQLIKDLSIKIGGVIDLRELTITLNSELKKLLGTEKVYVAIKDTHQTKRYINFNLLNEEQGRVNFTKERLLIADEGLVNSYLSAANIVTKKEALADKNMSKDILKKLSKYDVEMVVPLEVHKKPVGFLFLSSKATQEPYTHEDVELIEIIASQVAISIENAKLYNEIKVFNRRLKMKIRSAVDEFENSNNDLTEANTKLVRAYEKLHKLDRAKSEFLSIASHQLRTPLTSIKGFTSLLMEGTYGKVSNQVNVVLSKIFISNERLINLVEDLLNISRIESGRFVFDLKENEICPLLESVVDSFAVPAKAKNIEIEYHHPTKKIPPFVFDKNKMQELLSNLLDNAVKYTKEGIIKVTLKQEAKKIQITIKDSGMGIPKGETEYIFDKFQRGKGVTQVNTEGVGLGLYVCKKVIEAHNGKIWAESEGIGKGSEFFVELRSDFRPIVKNSKK